MQTIEIYGTQTCVFCERAKTLLRLRGYEFVYHDLTNDPDRQAEFTARTHGARTVPQIFVGATLIGGFTALERADEAGELSDLVALGA